MIRFTKKEWKRGDIDFIDSSPLPERYFTFISLVLAVASTILTGWSVVQSIPGWVILIKDLTIFFTLLILTLFFFLRYRMVLTSKRNLKKSLVKEIEGIRKLVESQFSIYHSLMNKVREIIFVEAPQEIYNNRFNYKNKSLNKLLETTLDNTVYSMNIILINHLNMRQKSISDAISFSIKVIVTGEIVKKICINMTNEEKSRIINSTNYVITLARDQDAIKQSKREILSTAYSLTKNTAFQRIYNNEPFFIENDLKTQYDLKNYQNETPEFWKKYNATAVVPIEHSDPVTQMRIVFGFLTVVSLNIHKQEVFSAKDTYPIMKFGADLLALAMFNIELLDRVEDGLERLK